MTGGNCENYYLQSLDTLVYLLEKNGGMGSFNDLCLSNLTQEEIMIFDIMKEFSCQISFLYKKIHKDMFVLEKEVLNEVLYKDKSNRKPLFIMILDGLQSGHFLAFYLHRKQ